VTDLNLVCANCPEGALYSYILTADFAQHFCGKHLPSFLRQNGAPVTLVVRTEAHDLIKAEALSTLLPKPAAPKAKSRKVVAKKPLMVEASDPVVGDTGTSETTETEETTPDGPQD
jgi:hypothetical protein